MPLFQVSLIAGRCEGRVEDDETGRDERGEDGGKRIAQDGHGASEQTPQLTG